MVAITGQRYDYLRIFPSGIMFNRFVVPRKRPISMPIDQSNNKLILGAHVHTLNSLAVCMKMNWMPILVIYTFVNYNLFVCIVELTVGICNPF